MKKTALLLVLMLLLTVPGCKKNIIPVKNETSSKPVSYTYKDGTYQEKSGYDSQNCWYKFTLVIKDNKISDANLEGFYNVLNGVYTSKSDKTAENIWYELTLTYDAGVFMDVKFAGKYIGTDGKEAVMDINYKKDKPEEYEKAQKLVTAINTLQSDLKKNNGDINLLKETDDTKDIFKTFKELYAKAVILANDDAADNNPIKMDSNFGKDITDAATKESAKKAVEGIMRYGSSLVEKETIDKVDKISGATLAFDVFKDLAKKCLEKAKNK